jgi:hypothetical protein
MEEALRDPVELTDTDLDVVAGGFGSAAAASTGNTAVATTFVGGGLSVAAVGGGLSVAAVGDGLSVALVNFTHVLHLSLVRHGF